MAKSHLKLVTPTTQKRTVAPTRRRNGDLRTREYLTEAEVERLMKAATGNRRGHRDATMILVAYRHSEYKRWVRNLYHLGLILRIPSEWEAPETPERKSS